VAAESRLVFDVGHLVFVVRTFCPTASVLAIAKISVSVRLLAVLFLACVRLAIAVRLPIGLVDCIRHAIASLCAVASRLR